MKGIIGAARARTYTPSSYGGGDSGGSAGGYGLSHGEGGEAGTGFQSGIPSAFGGPGPNDGTFFEGGVRGGGVSALETMPSSIMSSKQNSYDEHRPARRGMVPMGVHGMGMEAEGPPEMPGDEDDDESSETEGEEKAEHACGMAGCGFAGKSAHGLARHALARHKKGQLAHALGGVRHGDAYKPPHQVIGETDNAEDMAQIRAQYDKAVSRIPPVNAGYGHGLFSSYADRSHGMDVSSSGGPPASPMGHGMGTSAGVKKGWVTRKGGGVSAEATALSEKALAAGVKARTSGHPRHLLDAADAHIAAGGAHEEAAHESRAKGRHQKAEYHVEQSHHHETATGNIMEQHRRSTMSGTAFYPKPRW